MNKYQYDDEFFLADEANIFPSHLTYEEEEIFIRYLNYGKY